MEVWRGGHVEVVHLFLSLWSQSYNNALLIKIYICSAWPSKIICLRYAFATCKLEAHTCHACRCFSGAGWQQPTDCWTHNTCSSIAKTHADALRYLGRQQLFVQLPTGNDSVNTVQLLFGVCQIATPIIAPSTELGLVWPPRSFASTWKGLISLASSTYAGGSLSIRTTKQPRRQGKLLARKSFLHQVQCASHRQSWHLGEWWNILASSSMCKKFSVSGGICFDRVNLMNINEKLQHTYSAIWLDCTISCNVHKSMMLLIPDPST